MTGGAAFARHHEIGEPPPDQIVHRHPQPLRQGGVGIVHAAIGAGGKITARQVFHQVGQAGFAAARGRAGIKSRGRGRRPPVTPLVMPLAAQRPAQGR